MDSRQGEAYRKERSVIHNEDDVGDQARVTRGEERNLQVKISKSS